MAVVDYPTEWSRVTFETWSRISRRFGTVLWDNIEDGLIYSTDRRCAIWVRIMQPHHSINMLYSGEHELGKTVGNAGGGRAMKGEIVRDESMYTK